LISEICYSLFTRSDIATIRLVHEKSLSSYPQSDGEILKIILEKLAYFLPWETAVNLTTFTTQSTTTSPQKHHRFRPHFLRPPSKNTSKLAISGP
jgi:hypothetical protein